MTRREIIESLPHKQRGIRVMPRTMLRYAIEKFPPDLRKWYMKGGRQ